MSFNKCLMICIRIKYLDLQSLNLPMKELFCVISKGTQILFRLKM